MKDSKAPAATPLAENIVDTASHDVNGKGQEVPTPVETGDPHANRAADKTDQTDAAVAETRGTEISRAQMINAIIAQLLGMDNSDLSQVVSSISVAQDATQPGVAASALPGASAANLGTIATKEETELLFAGQDLSEEFKEKATTLFEAAVSARIIAERLLIEEAAEARIETVINETTEKLVNDVDKYLGFAADQVVEASKAQLEVAQRNIVSEGFVAGVLNLVEQFKIDSDVETKSAVAGLEAQLAEAKAKLNESVEREVTLTEELKGFRKATILDEVAGSLTAMQRGRFKTLAEAIECDTPETYRAQLTTIAEAVTAATKAPAAPATLAPLNESFDGVPSMAAEVAKAPSTDPVMKSVLSALSRTR